MMNLKITPYHFEELIKKGYSLDVIYLLKLVEQKFELKPFCDDSLKIATLYQTLIRKALICSDDKLTTQGVELLKFMETDEVKHIVKTKPSTTEFEDWWKVFPGTDTFTHKEKIFSGSRSLRQNKEGCKLKFSKILLEGEYTALDLINALKFDVEQKKESSVKTGNNKLTYMQNSLTYLNQRSYEPFIELIKEGTKIEEAPNKSEGSTNI